MWKNNRPEGWDRDKILTDKWWDEHDGLDSVGLVEDAVEAGADAMLEGLKKDGIPLEPYDSDNFLNRSGVKGYLVFIPEE